MSAPAWPGVRLARPANSGTVSGRNCAADRCSSAGRASRRLRRDRDGPGGVGGGRGRGQGWHAVACRCAGHCRWRWRAALPWPPPSRRWAPGRWLLPGRRCLPWHCGAGAWGQAWSSGWCSAPPFFVPLISWLVNVAWYVWAALAVAEMVSFAVLTVGQRLLLRLRAWPAAVAGWWVAAEAVRDRWPYAFPWGRLAMSQAGAPTARWVAIGGAPLLTFLLALAGACLAWLLLGPAQPTERPPASRGQERPRALHRRVLPALAFARRRAGAGRPPAPGGPGHSRRPNRDRGRHSGGCPACAEPA